MKIDWRFQTAVVAALFAAFPASAVLLDIQGQPAAFGVSMPLDYGTHDIPSGTTVTTSSTTTSALPPLAPPWQLVTNAPDWGPRNGAGALVFNERMWLIGGHKHNSLATTYADVWSSVNGRNWTLVSSNAASGPRELFGQAVLGERMWVMGGVSDGGRMLNDVWSSADGVAWVQASSNAAWSARNEPAVLAHDGKLWLMGGQAAGGANPFHDDVWFSTNGADWVLATAHAPWGPRFGMGHVLHDGKMWIMGGYGPAFNQARNDVWSSSNGVDWVQVATNAGWSTRWMPACLRYDNRFWIMGGLRPDTSRMNDVWWSADGAQWQAAASAPWASRDSAAALTYDNAMWIMGGQYGYGLAYGDVWRTPPAPTNPPPSLADGLVLHYTFDADEGSSVTDQSGNGHTGMVHGATWTPNGVSGGAFAFTGADQDIDAGDLDALDGCSSMTLAAWVWLDDNTGRRGLMSKDSRPIRGFLFEAVNPVHGVPLGSVGGYPYGDSSCSEATHQMATGRWSHVVMVYDGSQPTSARLRIFEDGVAEAMTTTLPAGDIPTATPMTANRFLIGNNYEPYGYAQLAGRVDDVRVYNRVLSASEILQVIAESGGATTTTTTSTTTSSTTTSSVTTTTTTSSTTTTASPPPNLRSAQPDFDGDSLADLGVYHEAAGNWYMRQSRDGAIFSGGPVNWMAGGVPVPGDYDGDKLADFAVYVQREGKWYILQSRDGQMLGGAPIGWGWSAAKPVPEDYDGDGKTDLAVYDPPEGRWYVRQSHDGKIMGGAPIGWGWRDTIPVPGDYDGDGKADLAAYYPAQGLWYVRQSHDGQMMGGAPIGWGWSAALPVQGDYDGDRRTDLAVYTPNDGKWFILASRTGALYSGQPIAWGAPTAMPVPNDYDGDGQTDIGVYVARPGKWYIRKSSDGTLLGGGSTVADGIMFGHPVVTPANTQYQVLRDFGLVP
ncbi:MAG: FG-GAP-like repeat-containing protein [Lentisphaerae bacterium]|nr:FG-GAP-like repeat-containing protein [Lentisphaerota bacterium]